MTEKVLGQKQNGMKMLLLLLGGLLLTVQVEQATIAGELYVNLRAALSPTVLGSGYGALWGGELKKGGRYEAFGGNVASCSGPTGTVG